MGPWVVVITMLRGYIMIYNDIYKYIYMTMTMTMTMYDYV